MRRGIVAKSLAVISGKGGSGKTTLALSIASMLSECGLKVLLVDCDFATNGATYFYENKLEKGTAVSSLFDILFDGKNTHDFVKINDNFHFLPSIKRISESNSATLEYRYNFIKDNFRSFYSSIDTSNDIIIFDCQAGYTDLLDIVLPYTEVNLAVMEADAISSSAIRSLYLKIANLIKERKIFQVFNKVTDEEYEIYSKISGGTVFTNIEAVKFDWMIRKAFAISKVPAFDNVSSKFGEQICNISSTILNNLFANDEFDHRLDFYRNKLKINNILEEKKEIEKEIETLKKSKRESNYKIYRTVYLIMIPLLVIPIFLSLYFMLDLRFEWSFITSIIISCLSSVIVIYTVFDLIKQRQNKNSDILKMQNKYNKILIELAELKKSDNVQLINMNNKN